MRRLDRKILAFVVATAFAAATIPITLIAASTGARPTLTADICHPNQAPDLPSNVTPAPPAAACLLIVTLASWRFSSSPTERAPRPADKPDSPPPESFA